MNLKLTLPEEDDDIDLTPLIDCIFLLVLFFMLTSSFIEEAKAYKIVLPRADKATTVDRAGADAISVTVDGRYFYRDAKGEEQVENLEVLLNRLQSRPTQTPPRPIILRCDARCEYRQYMRVKNLLKLAGVETVFEEVEVRHDKAKP